MPETATPTAPTVAAPAITPAPEPRSLAASIEAAGDAVDALTKAPTLDALAPTPEVTGDPAPVGTEAPAPDGTEAPPEGTEPPADPDAPKLFDVVVPLPNADGSKGPRGTGVLNMQFETQEAADAVRHLVNQGKRAKDLEARVGTLADTAAALALAKEAPDQFLHIVTGNKPEGAQPFVASWMEQNPDLALKLFGDLKFDSMTDEMLHLRAENARMRADGIRRTGAEKIQATRHEEQFVERASTTIAELAATIGLAERTPLHDVFVNTASGVLEQALAKNPGLKAGGDLALLLQDTVREFQDIQKVKAGRVQRATVAPRDPAGQFAERDKRAAQLRRQAPGATPLAPVTVEKVAGADVYAQIAALQGRATP